MKKIVAFCFFPAFVPSSNGGESRLFNFYKSLSQFYHITLLTSSHSGIDEEKVYHGSNFIERRIPKDLYFSEQWDELSQYASGGDLSAVCVAASGECPTLLHKAYLEEYASADIIIHDFPFTIHYDLFFGVDDKVRVYNAHNCETTLYKVLHPEAKSQPIWDIVKSTEVKILSGCDVVLYCNDGDLGEFKKLAPQAKYRSIFASNGLSPLAIKAGNREHKQLDSIIFIGSGHPPNVEAALQIIKNIAPALPNITFHIIGDCLAKGKYPKNIIRHGFVDDNTKAQIINSASLAINPMGMGGGSNVKMFDLFSYGIPILSSEFGMRGIKVIDEETCLISPISEFVKVINLWSERDEALQQIGKTGKKFATKNYSWDIIVKNVAKKLAKITKRTHWDEKFILVLNDYDSFNDYGGGGVRTRGIYTAVNEWCPVIFICFSEDSRLSVRSANNKTVIFSIPKTQQHLKAQQKLNSYSHVSVNDIISHRYCQYNEMLMRVYSVLKKECRNIVIEHPYMGSIPLACNDRFIYSSHNYETQIKKDLLQHHPFYDELIRDVEGLEKKVVECASAVITVSIEDANAFVKGVRTSGGVIVVNNGASQPEPANQQELASVRQLIKKDNSVVFIGSAHIPNIDAVRYIVEKLVPSSPNIHFHIVGSVCSAFPDIHIENISFWGTLSSTMKSAVMQSCRVALNPVISGGGSNIKLADYLANKLFVVTTAFGGRGYPQTVHKHLIVAELNDFNNAIDQAFLEINNEGVNARFQRRKFFDNNLSMAHNAKSVVSLLKGLDLPKKRVLFVTYRYTSPCLGGAESMLGNLISAMNETSNFQIDVIAPEVSKINNRDRFSEVYEFDTNIGVQVGLKNVRFARFPLDEDKNVSSQVANAWYAQILFEKNIYQQLKSSLKTSGLAWGWGDSEENVNARWGFTSCGLYLHKEMKVYIKCYAPRAIVIWITNKEGHLIQMQEEQGAFEITFTEGGTIEITASIVLGYAGDMRPLAFHVTELSFDNNLLDLSQATLINTAEAKKIQILDNAYQKVREPLGVKLTEMRGPFSVGLENYLEQNIINYDLVVTHNNIFRPAVVAVEIANKNNIPIISIPHAHLDDDFYHFPDVDQSIINSDLILAAPRIACDFYSKKGGEVAYLPAGINTKEHFSDDDVKAFREICTVQQPFLLVLGRKASAKGYQQVIDAVQLLSEEFDVHVIMIGPDDDGLPINSLNASYLGRQSREIVRGALLSCKALVNMSVSESFGIVLLEAWMAGKPVIVNNKCAAFHDLAIDKYNSLMVDDSLSLKQAISEILKDSDLCEYLAKNGNEILTNYDWSHVGEMFVDFCTELINR